MANYKGTSANHSIVFGTLNRFGSQIVVQNGVGRRNCERNAAAGIT